MLLDEGVSREVKRELRRHGHDVEHVLDLGLKAQPDPVIFLTAQQRQAALYTLNRTHFELLVSAWTTWALGSHAGLILPIKGQPSPSHVISSLHELLEHVPSLLNQIVYI
ncbi:MAG TPA: DUF5615 family PIN-like protein [Ktedonobacterales bacterium]